MRNPYGQSQNINQRMLGNQQALASYQIPQETNKMEAILGILGKAMENRPKNKQEDAGNPLPTPPTTPKTTPTKLPPVGKGEVSGKILTGAKNVGSSLASIIGKLFKRG